MLIDLYKKLFAILLFGILVAGCTSVMDYDLDDDVDDAPIDIPAHAELPELEDSDAVELDRAIEELGDDFEVEDLGLDIFD